MLCVPSETIQYLNRCKRLHGEELGGPEFKVEAKAVEESPEKHHPAWAQPQQSDPVGTEGRYQLLQHTLMLSTQVVIHIPESKTDTFARRLIELESKYLM